MKREDVLISLKLEDDDTVKTGFKMDDSSDSSEELSS